MDALLTKKRAIKQGTMQQLLTGKKRLPGFQGEWETKTLGELFNFSGGFSASRDQLGINGYCYLHCGDIHKSDKTYINVDLEFQTLPKFQISIKGVSPKSLLRDGAIVFVDASEDSEGTSKHTVIYNQTEIVFISGLHTIVAKSKYDSIAREFKRYCFQTPNIKSQFLFYAAGTKVSGISKTNIKKINLTYPFSQKEQQAIAKIISDMDMEITALE